MGTRMHCNHACHNIASSDASRLIRGVPAAARLRSTSSGCFGAAAPLVRQSLRSKRKFGVGYNNISVIIHTSWDRRDESSHATLPHAVLWRRSTVLAEALDAAQPFDLEAVQRARVDRERQRERQLSIGIVGFGVFGQFLVSGMDLGELGRGLSMPSGGWGALDQVKTCHTYTGSHAHGQDALPPHPPPSLHPSRPRLGQAHGQGRPPSACHLAVALRGCCQGAGCRLLPGRE